MSWRISLTLLLVSIFIGCGIKNSTLNVDILKNDVNNSDNFLIIEALYNQYNDKNISKSVENYIKLYEKTKSDIYLKSAIKLSFNLNDEEQIDKLLKVGLKKFPKDIEMITIYAKRLIQEKKYKKAQKIMRGVLKKEKNAQNYTIYGTIFYFQKQYKRALKYFLKSYKIDLSESTLIKIATLLDENLNDRKRAIEYLESFTRLNYASEGIYFKLLHLYGKETNVDGLIDTYKSMFNKFGNKSYAQKVTELLVYKNDTKGAIKFLEEQDFDKDMLLDLYTQNGRFQDAFKLAQKLYKKSGKAEYLGRMAIYEYEANNGKITPKIIKSISKKFDEVIEKMQLPLFLNYYGYLLIDHDVDVSKGIKYVKMALEREPESVYYIDSLAWGYYKQKKCKIALKEIEKIIDKTNEGDIKKHYDLIKKCLKGKH